MARKQNDLPAMEGPGVSTPRIPALDDAAEAFFKVDEKRKRIKESLDAAAMTLGMLMHENESKLGRNGDGELIYRYDDRVVTCKPGKEKVKVVISGSEDDE